MKWNNVIGKRVGHASELATFSQIHVLYRFRIQISTSRTNDYLKLPAIT